MPSTPSPTASERARFLAAVEVLRGAASAGAAAEAALWAALRWVSVGAAEARGLLEARDGVAALPGALLTRVLPDASRAEGAQDAQGALRALGARLGEGLEGAPLGAAGRLGALRMATSARQARKGRGGYYTPPALVARLLDATLDPLLTRDLGGAALPAICDPACGSGHFLVAAARRVVRARGERAATVVARCLHGVDVDPLSVELCRLALWLEAADPSPDLPAQLARHVRCADSLLGATPALLRAGVPAVALRALGPDDDERSLRRHQRQRRRLRRAGPPPPAAARSAASADAWCASFFRDAAGAPVAGEEALRAGATGALAAATAGAIEALAAERRFLHWHLAFPERLGVADADDAGHGAGWRGGFDLIVGNPPFINAIRGEHDEPTRRLLRVSHPELGGTADLAAHFLALARRLCRAGGWIGMVLPRALLEARAVHALRARSVSPLAPALIEVPSRSDLFAGAEVHVCLLALGPVERCQVMIEGVDAAPRWVRVRDASWWRAIQADAPPPASADAPRLDARFELSGSMTTQQAYDVLEVLVDARDVAGLRFVNTGLIDPRRCLWGEATCRYLKRLWRHPRVPDDAALRADLQRRVARARRPKLLIAGLSARLECFVDAEGACIGAVSTFTVTHPRDDVEALVALCEHLLSDAVNARLQAELGARARSGGSITLSKRFLAGLPLPPSLAARASPEAPRADAARDA